MNLVSKSRGMKSFPLDDVCTRQYSWMLTLSVSVSLVAVEERRSFPSCAGWSLTSRGRRLSFLSICQLLYSTSQA